jgi:hypothetical protein
MNKRWHLSLKVKVTNAWLCTVNVNEYNVTYITNYTWVLYNKKGIYFTHTVTIVNDFFFTVLEADEIITLKIIVLY